MKLRMHKLATCSHANGPGPRAVLWTQGCAIRCDGCFNAPTHDGRDGEWSPVDRLAKQLNALPVRGVTFSGGEPLDQPTALLALIEQLDPRLDLLLYSGYRLGDIRRDPTSLAVLCACDAALVGPYDRTLDHPYRGKDLVLHSSRITAEELAPHRAVEIVVGPQPVITGLPTHPPLRRLAAERV